MNDSGRNYFENLMCASCFSVRAFNLKHLYVRDMDDKTCANSQIKIQNKRLKYYAIVKITGI
jgi:hypothetical protein